MVLTDSTTELARVLDGPPVFDIIKLTQHIFGTHDEVPYKVESRVLVRRVLPLGVFNKCTRVLFVSGSENNILSRKQSRIKQNKFK